MRGLSLALLPLALLLSISEASKNYVVTVGKGSQLKFDPETVTAAAGDTITYQFFAKVTDAGQCRVDHGSVNSCDDRTMR
jgi:plastocyanin